MDEGRNIHRKIVALEMGIRVVGGQGPPSSEETRDALLSNRFTVATIDHQPTHILSFS